jgi:hypothetical protein
VQIREHAELRLNITIRPAVKASLHKSWAGRDAVGRETGTPVTTRFAK